MGTISWKFMIGFSTRALRFLEDSVAGPFRRAPGGLSEPLENEDGHDREEIDVRVWGRCHVSGESFDHKGERHQKGQQGKLSLETSRCSPPRAPGLEKNPEEVRTKGQHPERSGSH